MQQKYSAQRQIASADFANNIPHNVNMPNTGEITVHKKTR